MAKGLLVSYAGYPYTPSSLMPDNGLASLAGALIQSGHEVKVLDYGTVDLVRRMIPEEFTPQLQKAYDAFIGKNPFAKVYQFMRLKGIDKRLQAHQIEETDKIAQELSAQVAREKQDFVGLKLWSGDGFEGAAKIAKQLRRDHPNVKIYGGGPQAYIFKERVFERVPLDALCYDEGEHTIVDLAQHSEDSRDISTIPNIFYRQGKDIIQNPLVKIIDLDSLPQTIYSSEVYPSIDPEKKIMIFTVDESRGCINSCPFCPQSAREDNRFRQKSAKRTVDEIERLQKQFGAKSFRLGGQMTPGKTLEAIAKEVLNRGLEIEFSSFGYVNTMRNTDFNLLRQAGLVAVFYGIESGSQRLLNDVLGKNVKVEEAEDVLRRTKEAGINTSFSLIVPVPGETRDTKKETLGFINRTQPDSVLLYFPGLYPNTTWGLNPESFGFEMLLPSSEYERKVMDYRIKNIFPPRFWDPLPYKVSGKEFRTFASETEKFGKEIENAGIKLFLADEHFLMTRRLNQNPGEFSKDIRKMFFSGNDTNIRNMVKKVNNN